MTELSDAFLIEEQEASLRKCKTGRILESLSDDDRDVLQKYLDSDMGVARIVSALKRAGHVVHDKTLTRHRKKLCACG